MKDLIKSRLAWLALALLLAITVTLLLSPDAHSETNPATPIKLPPTAASLVKAAREQIGVTTSYDGAYQRLNYPMGDIASNTGVCTDVVVRALRRCGYDLQLLIHEDMRSNFKTYPQNWGLRQPDHNIDHRRVPNQRHYFKRRQMHLPLPKNPAKALDHFQPGDFVTCTVPPNLPHIMIISDRTNDKGTPLVIHNLGRGTVEEDRLLKFPLTGHYRWFTGKE